MPPRVSSKGTECMWWVWGSNGDGSCLALWERVVVLGVKRVEMVQQWRKRR